MSQKKDNEKFCSPEKYQVIIPYSDLEKMVHMAEKIEHIEAMYSRMNDQYQAIYGMFSECLEKIREIYRFVQD